jgi:hypothetical protein
LTDEALFAETPKGVSTIKLKTMESFFSMEIASLREQFLEAQGKNDAEKASELARRLITLRARVASKRRQNWWSNRKTK